MVRTDPSAEVEVVGMAVDTAHLPPDIDDTVDKDVRWRCPVRHRLRPAPAPECTSCTAAAAKPSDVPYRAPLLVQAAAVSEASGAQRTHENGDVSIDDHSLLLTHDTRFPPHIAIRTECRSAEASY